MYLLITTLISGLLISYFATQNTHTVDIYLGSYTASNVPLYFVILCSALVPLLLSIIIYIAKSLSASLTISELQDELKSTESKVVDMTYKAHKLELENTRLSTLNGHEEIDSNGF